MSEALQLTEFVRRPGVGRSGRNIRVRANFFEVLSFTDANIIHYDVTIIPEVPPALNKKVYQQFEDHHRTSSLGGSRPVFDGRKNIFSPRPLPFGDTVSFDVTLPEDDRVTSRRRPPRSFKLRIRKAGDINMEELHRFLDGRGQLTHNCLTAIMALNVLIRHRPSMQYATVGRSFYTPQGSQALFGGVEVWQGYYQSARPTPGCMMINVDLSATAFYEGGPLILMVAKLLGRRSPDDLHRGLNERDRRKVEKSLKNLKIRVAHRHFKILKLTPTPASQTKFETSDNGPTDVATYFQKTYDKRLNFAHLPCVAVRGDVFLPIEVCEVIEGQRHLRKLNEKQNADMIKFTCQPPHARANKIRQSLEILNYRGNEYLQQFGMKVSNDMAIVKARVLPTPTLQYHPSSRESTILPRDGTWDLGDKKVATGATLSSWSVVVFGQEREFPIQAVGQFVRELVIVCQNAGMNIPNRNPPILHANPRGDIEASFKQAWLRAGNSAKAQPQLILCVLPNTGVPLYAEIKRVGDTVIGVATQCVLSRHMSQAEEQYFANVCLKINAKLGGMHSFLTPTQIPFITDRPTIIMGASVTHPSPGDTTRPSIASLCASMDAKASRYAASIRVQTGRVEIISDLVNMVKELLKTFYQTCGRKPERILFYRSGVSEGQFMQVLNDEIRAVRAACQALDVDYRPTITFIVAQKRHHTRFFPRDIRDSDSGTGNCLPGTVVESKITHPFEFDFYLQSHAGSRPTHYHVLYDENNFTADSIQTLSYNICYLYARCTRAISVVPPIYYARMVCRRARYHGYWSDTEDSEEGIGVASIFGSVKPELQKVMYFM